jgi:hypothetical protein
MQTAASIELECAGKGVSAGREREKKPAPLRPGGGFLSFPRVVQATNSGGIAA